MSKSTGKFKINNIYRKNGSKREFDGQHSIYKFKINQFNINNGHGYKLVMFGLHRSES